MRHAGFTCPSFCAANLLVLLPFLVPIFVLVLILVLVLVLILILEERRNTGQGIATCQFSHRAELAYHHTSATHSGRKRNIVCASIDARVEQRRCSTFFLCLNGGRGSTVVNTAIHFSAITGFPFYRV